jgi:hypothetical protein
LPCEAESVLSEDLHHPGHCRHGILGEFSTWPWLGDVLLSLIEESLSLSAFAQVCSG